MVNGDCSGAELEPKLCLVGNQPFTPDRNDRLIGLLGALSPAGGAN